MRVIVQNFKCYGKTPSLFSFKDETITLLNGKSGDGKSSIFQAIMWCLYGNLRGTSLKPIASSTVSKQVSKKTESSSPCDFVTEHINAFGAGPSATVVILLFGYDNNDYDGDKVQFIVRRKAAATAAVEVVNENREIFKGDAATSWIVKRFGSKNLWMASSYIPQNGRNPLISLSNDERFSIFYELSFSSLSSSSSLETSPEEIISRIAEEVAQSKKRAATASCAVAAARDAYEAALKEVVDSSVEYVASSSLSPEEIEREIKLLWDQMDNDLETIRQQNKELTERKTKRTTVKNYEKMLKDTEETLLKPAKEACEKAKQSFLQAVEDDDREDNSVGSRNDKNEIQRRLSALREELFNQRSRQESIKRFEAEIKSLIEERDVVSISGEGDEDVGSVTPEAIAYLEGLIRFERSKIKMSQAEVYETIQTLVNDFSILKLFKQEAKVFDFLKESYSSFETALRCLHWNLFRSFNRKKKTNMEWLDNNIYTVFPKTSSSKDDLLLVSKLMDSLLFNEPDLKVECPACSACFKAKEIKVISSSIDDILKIKRHEPEIGLKLKEAVRLIEENEKIDGRRQNKVSTGIPISVSREDAIRLAEKLLNSDSLDEKFQVFEVVDEILSSFDFSLLSGDAEIGTSTFEDTRKSYDEYQYLSERVTSLFSSSVPRIHEFDTLKLERLKIQIENKKKLSEVDRKIKVVKRSLADVSRAASTRGDEEIESKIRNDEKLLEEILLKEKKIDSLRETYARERSNVKAANEQIQRIKSTLLTFSSATVQGDDFDDSAVENQINQKSEDVLKARKHIKDLNFSLNLSKAKKILDERIKKETDAKREVEIGIDVARKITHLTTQKIHKVAEGLSWTVNKILEDLFGGDLSPATVSFEIGKIEIGQRTSSKVGGTNTIGLKINYRGVEYDTPSLLSGGETDRLSIALTLTMALYSNSQMILLDECMASLDENLREKCFDVLRKFAPGKTIVNICHEAVEGHHDDKVEIA